MKENIEEINYTDLNNLAEVKYPVVNVTEPEYCKLHVQYEADPVTVEDKINESLTYVRKLKVPGFRVGKAPDSALKLRLRPQINQFVAREMANQAIDDIQFETGCKIIGQPSCNDVKVNGNHFSCTIDLMKQPDVDLQTYKFDIPKPALGLDKVALTEHAIRNLRSRLGDVEPYEETDEVEFGDQITFSFTATIDGQPFDGSVVEGEMYMVGQNRWKGFDNYLVGMKADETREFDFIFEDAGNLNEKTAHFTLTVHMGAKRKLHPLNDELFTQIGVKDLDELTEKLNVISARTVAQKEEEFLRNQVAIKLVEHNPVEIPNYLIEIESKNSLAAQSGINPADITVDLITPELLERSKKGIQLSFILDAIREVEPDAILNNSEVQQHLVNHPALQGQDIRELMKNQQFAQQVPMLVHSIKEEFTLQWVVSQSNIIS